MRRPLWRHQSLLLPPQRKHPKLLHHALWLRPLQRLRLKRAFLAGSKVCLAALKPRQPRLQRKLKKTNAAAKPDAMVALKAVQMDAVSAHVMVSAVAVTAAVADAAVAKAAAWKDALKGVLKGALKIATKAVAANAANAALRRVLKRVLKRALKVCVRSVKNAPLARCVVKRRVTTAVATCRPVEMHSLATKAALKTANHASHVLTVRAVNAPVANVATALIVVIAVTAFRAMP